MIDISKQKSETQPIAPSKNNTKALAKRGKKKKKEKKNQLRRCLSFRAVPLLSLALDSPFPLYRMRLVTFFCLFFFFLSVRADEEASFAEETFSNSDSDTSLIDDLFLDEALDQVTPPVYHNHILASIKIKEWDAKRVEEERKRVNV